MKKKIILSIILLFTILGITYFFIVKDSNTYTRSYSHYRPEDAIAYSYMYAQERNPNFPNFEKNCVCYVSQCLVAGGLEMDKKDIKPITINITSNTSKKWYCYSYEADPYKPIYYNLSASFSNNKHFVPYWTKTAGVPYTILDNTPENREYARKNVKPGDVLLLYGNNSPHAALIVKVDDKDIYYNSNTNDRIEYPLSSVSESSYKKFAYMNFVS